MDQEKRTIDEHMRDIASARDAGKLWPVIIQDETIKLYVSAPNYETAVTQVETQLQRKVVYNADTQPVFI